METTMYGVMKNGAFLSFLHDDWFDEVSSNCLTVSEPTAKLFARNWDAEVVSFTVTLNK